MGRHMPEATFIVHLDDFHGFLVKERYPPSLTLNEKILNLIFYEQQKDKKEELSYSYIEGMKIAAYSSSLYPRWMICSILSAEEDFDQLRVDLAGSGRLILALLAVDPDSFSLEEILKTGSVLKELSEEQQLAEVFLTPSSALLLERMQKEGIEKAAKLSIWLREQIQNNDVDLREAMAPLMDSGVVKVELLGKTSEIVFLVKDVFGYREPPVDSILKTKEAIPSIAEQYREFVTEFFSPPPPNKGYNPTVPVDNANSPIFEDREKISRILAERIQYRVLTSLRDQPLSIVDISQKTSLPESIVKKVLFALEAEKIAVRFDEGDLWGLLTNPRIESFLPEYVLPIISKKLSEKEISPEAARRHLELLIQTWGVAK
jgi:predicted transcriptional regulator